MSMKVGIMPCGNVETDGNDFKYNGGLCGICETDQADWCYWPSPVSYWAHKNCLKQILPAEKVLFQAIFAAFENSLPPGREDKAHMIALRAIKKHCSPKTILEYYTANGQEKTTEIFKTIGVAAVKKYAGAKL